MTINSKKISEHSACTSPKRSDLLLIASSNSSANSGTGFENKKLELDKLLTISYKPITPTNSSNTQNCVVKDLWTDGTYLYFCSSNTQVKRIGPFNTF